MKQKLRYAILTLLVVGYSMQGQEALTHKIVEDYDSDTGTYTEVTKEAYTYDSEGRLTESLMYYQDSGNWIQSNRATYTYDSNGYLKENIWSYWDPQTQVFTNISRQVTNYTGIMMNEQLFYQWENNSWRADEKTDFVYDDGQVLRSYTTSEWESNAWKEDERGTITYDSNQKIAEITTEAFEENAWILNDKTTYLRNPSTGRLTDIIYEEWDATGWANDEKISYSTDANGNQLSVIIYESYDGASWTEDEKTEYAHDTNTLMSKYNNPFNVNAHLQNLGVDEVPHYNKVLSSVESENENGQIPQRGNASWNVESRTIYYYSDDTMALEDLSNTDFMVVYPNPAVNALQIQFKEPLKAVAHLYDVNGRLILKQSLNALSTAVNIENFGTGFYVLKVITDQGYATKRITKI